MTPAEFKAWFDGFTEAFSGCPTKAQWARIKERVSEIDGKPVTERVYVDRYWPLYRMYQDRIFYGSGVGAAGSPVYCGTSLSPGAQSVSGSTVKLENAGYHSLTAMNALGKADALALAS